MFTHFVFKKHVFLKICILFVSESITSVKDGIYYITFAQLFAQSAYQMQSADFGKLSLTNFTEIKSRVCDMHNFFFFTSDYDSFKF